MCVVIGEGGGGGVGGGGRWRGWGVVDEGGGDRGNPNPYPKSTLVCCFLCLL